MTSTSPAVSSSTVAPNAGTNGQAQAISSLRATKRKLDDAMQSLDNAVNRSEPDDAPPALKKARYSTRGSLYSTLAKYGIKSKDPKERPSASVGVSDADVLTKSTPHLTAILARTATRTRKALPFRFNARTPATVALSSSLLQATSEYRPSSTRSFLARLATYKLSTYANKPPAIDAVAASKCGWVNDGKDRLVCGICSVSWVVAGRDGMNRDAANALVEKQRVSLIEMHKPGCPWKTKQCDDSIYCIPLQTPAVMAREIQKNALALEPLMQGIEIKHPLTSNQVQSLRSALSTIESSPPQAASSAAPDTITSASAAETPTVSDTAQLTSFFGWAPAPLPPRRPRISSLTRDRASSIPPSTPLPPSLSRAASVSVTRAPADTNGSASRSTPLRDVFRFESPLPGNAKRDTSLLHCSLCQRRIGLWAFAPPPNTVASGSNPEPELDQTQRRPQQRPFDLLKEHRSYCPYVVRSTIVPSLQTAPTPARAASSAQQLAGANGALEGWRAVLTIVLRFGMGQRQRMGIGISAGGVPCEEGGEMQIDGVEAMMAGVKSRGGKELLKYVRGLLG